MTCLKHLLYARLSLGLLLEVASLTLPNNRVKQGLLHPFLGEAAHAVGRAREQALAQQ